MGTGPLSFSQVLRGPRWLHSPRLPAWQKKILKEMIVRAPSAKTLMWILSSGTQSVNEVKALGVTSDAVLASAAAANKHLSVGREDRWLLTLPTYHVGGLGVLARAHLSGSRIFALPKWNAGEFAKRVARDWITLCSLVPTQVYDLVLGSVECPASLRAVVVGGGSLDPALYAAARGLGWPLLPSYGLTEACSQVATAGLDSLSRSDFPSLKVLPHLELDLREQRIFVRGESVCRYIARGGREGWFSLEDPLRDGWLPTEDLGEWVGRELRVLGRRDDVVKILGTLVPVNQVEHDALAFFRAAGLKGDLVVVAVGGGREGCVLVLVTDAAGSLRDWDECLSRYNAQVSGPFRIKQFCWVPRIPRGELGKVRRADLLSRLRLG